VTLWTTGIIIKATRVGRRRIQHAEADPEEDEVKLLRNNNNNNINHDDIYSVVIMTEVIVRVHSVHLVNVEQRQAAADPQTKRPDLGCECACFRQLASTTTIAIYYYYSARKLILIYSPTEGRRLS